ncbi:MAG: hypothetical protein ACREQZ_09355 [Woeseiaceae bacterium]
MLRIEVIGVVVVSLGLGAQVWGNLTAPSVTVARAEAVAQLQRSGDSVLQQVRDRLRSEQERMSMHIVSPVGWQKSTVYVTQGQELTFRAEGRITIALAELLRTVETRLAIERRRSRAGLEGDDFTPAELDSITPRWDWIGPDGYGKYRSQTKPGRERTLPIPDAPIGSLVALIGDDAGPPERPTGEPFLIGSARTLVADRGGVLWFSINDVGRYPSKPADYARIWFRDNSGFFVVHVSVRG